MSKSENGSLSNHNPASHQRLCHMVKREDFDGYGFNLHSEKGKPGQYIGKVDEKSPAEESGLRQGDRIIEVNGVNIGNETHKQVVQRIKAIENEVRLLVIDPEHEKQNNKQNNNNNNKTTTDTSSSASTAGIKTPTTTTPTSDDKQNHSPMLNSDKMSKKSPSSSIKNNVNNNVKSETNGHMKHDLENTNNMNGGSSSGNQQQKTPGSGLNLTMTAAEMRAKLLSKKKYDPKNDTVDLRKKFDIIQKL